MDWGGGGVERDELGGAATRTVAASPCPSRQDRTPSLPRGWRRGVPRGVILSSEKRPSQRRPAMMRYFSSLSVKRALDQMAHSRSLGGFELAVRGVRGRGVL